MIWTSPSIIFQCEFSCHGDYVIQWLHFHKIWYEYHQALFFDVNSVFMVIMSSGDYGNHIVPFSPSVYSSPPGYLHTPALSVPSAVPNHQAIKSLSFCKPTFIIISPNINAPENWYVVPPTSCKLAYLISHNQYIYKSGYWKVAFQYHGGLSGHLTPLALYFRHILSQIHQSVHPNMHAISHSLAQHVHEAPPACAHWQPYNAIQSVGG